VLKHLPERVDIKDVFKHALSGIKEMTEVYRPAVDLMKEVVASHSSVFLENLKEFLEDIKKALVWGVKKVNPETEKDMAVRMFATDYCRACIGVSHKSSLTVLSSAFLVFSSVVTKLLCTTDLFFSPTPPSFF
jgi:hypothetical protein